MPKKTRQEKIIANLKRQISIQNKPTVSTATATATSIKNEIKPFNNPYKIQLNKQAAINTNQQTGYLLDHSHVVKDLKKIFLISIIAVIFEGLLYFLMQK